MGKYLALIWMLILAPLARSEEIVVIVHPSVVVASVSQARLANIYFGAEPRWPDGTPVIPFDVAGEIPQRVEFYRTVLDRTLPQVRLYRARLIFAGLGVPPAELESGEAMLKHVASVRGAIGFLPRSMVDKSVQVIAVIR